jgi:hypothetical protein
VETVSRRSPLPGTLEDRLRKAPDKGFSIGAPFKPMGACNLEGISYTEDFER